MMSQNYGYHCSLVFVIVITHLSLAHRKKKDNPLPTTESTQGRKTKRPLPLTDPPLRGETLCPYIENFYQPLHYRTVVFSHHALIFDSFRVISLCIQPLGWVPSFPKFLYSFDSIRTAHWRSSVWIVFETAQVTD